MDSGAVTGRATGHDQEPAAAPVSVWMVNYNSTQWLARVLSGLTSERIRSIVVLDNASEPQQRADLLALAEGRTRLRVLLSEVNLGFGGGHNRISAVTSPTAPDDELVWLLNPDTVVGAGAIDVLCDALTSDAADIVSPVILTGPAQHPVVWFAGGRIDPRRGSVVPDHVGAPAGSVPDTPLISSAFLSGAAMLMARRTFEELGGFREDLFLYWEDVELCLRAAASGLRLAVATGAVIWHAEGGSSPLISGVQDTGTSRTAFYYSARNRIVVCAQPGRAVGLIAGPGSPYLLRLTAAALVKGGRGRWAKAWAVLQGSIDGVRGRTGDAGR